MMDAPSSPALVDTCLGLAQRLLPSGKARFFVGVSRAAAGDLRRGEEILLDGVRTGAIGDCRTYALLSAGIACVEGGRRSRGQLSYQAALESSPSSIQCLVSVAGLAFILGRDRDGEEALERLKWVGEACSVGSILRQQDALWSDPLRAEASGQGPVSLCNQISATIRNALS
ncbi:MAG: hypothetical protein KUG67_03380 [Proteobacteria bacterium]|nr:hypothetical protein [Pseudomonadota bacterium]